MEKRHEMAQNQWYGLRGSSAVQDLDELDGANASDESKATRGEGEAHEVMKNDEEAQTRVRDGTQ